MKKMVTQTVGILKYFHIFYRNNLINEMYGMQTFILNNNKIKSKLEKCENPYTLFTHRVLMIVSSALGLITGQAIQTNSIFDKERCCSRSAVPQNISVVSCNYPALCSTR